MEKFKKNAVFPRVCGRLAALFAGLLLVTWLFQMWNLDLRIQRQFYDPASGWPWGQGRFWLFLYHYGTVPGLVLTLTALIFFYLSFIRRRWEHLRVPMLVVALTAVIGAGVLVNGVLKPFWGRPRPREVVEFGGQWEYRPAHRPGIPGRGQSFPCGHCTMGFLFITLFYLPGVSRKWAVPGGCAGIAGGLLLGGARILQGAHFATDVLWSGGIVLMTAVLLHDGLIPAAAPWLTRQKALSKARKRLLGAMIALILVAVTTAFLTRRPVYETYTRTFTPPQAMETLTLSSNVDFARPQAPLRGRGRRSTDGKRPWLRLDQRLPRPDDHSCRRRSEPGGETAGPYQGILFRAYPPDRNCAAGSL